MPKSRSRSKPAAPQQPPRPAGENTPNPPWFVPTFVTLLVVGLIWVVATYLLRSAGPIPGLGSWNLAVGFGMILVGFGMTMRWR